MLIVFRSWYTATEWFQWYWQRSDACQWSLHCISFFHYSFTKVAGGTFVSFLLYQQFKLQGSIDSVWLLTLKKNVPTFKISLKKLIFKILLYTFTLNLISIFKALWSSKKVKEFSVWMHIFRFQLLLQKVFGRWGIEGWKGGDTFLFWGHWCPVAFISHYSSKNWTLCSALKW